MSNFSAGRLPRSRWDRWTTGSYLTRTPVRTRPWADSTRRPWAKQDFSTISALSTSTNPSPKPRILERRLQRARKRSRTSDGSRSSRTQTATLSPCSKLQAECRQRLAYHSTLLFLHLIAERLADVCIDWCDQLALTAVNKNGLSSGI